VQLHHQGGKKINSEFLIFFGESLNKLKTEEIFAFFFVFEEKAEKEAFTGQFGSDKGQPVGSKVNPSGSGSDRLKTN
jgi:hypothetical protein